MKVFVQYEMIKIYYLLVQMSQKGVVLVQCSRICSADYRILKYLRTGQHEYYGYAFLCRYIPQEVLILKISILKSDSGNNHFFKNAG